MTERKRIAFVAHNAMKAQMVSFCMKNQGFIESLGYDIVTTGSTGNRLEESGFTIYKKYESGARGGDFDIGARINSGKIELLFFFVDPFSAHAHESDINGLQRLCNVNNIAIAPNPRTAELVLKGMMYEAHDAQQKIIEK